MRQKRRGYVLEKVLERGPRTGRRGNRKMWTHLKAEGLA
jgi:hypothetical protein